MDIITILIMLGFVASGALIGVAIGIPLGRRSVWRDLEFDAPAEREEVLDAEVIL